MYLEKVVQPKLDAVASVAAGDVVRCAWTDGATIVADSLILEHVSNSDFDLYECKHPKLGNLTVSLRTSGECVLLGCPNLARPYLSRVNDSLRSVPAQENNVTAAICA